MSKTYQRCPVYFVTEGEKLTVLWLADPHGLPVCVAFMEKSSGRVTHGRDLPLDKVQHLCGEGLKLDQLISHGLASSSSSPTPWTQFLTQGLYDPRLFAFFIRPFLVEPIE
jgi:hypothetical protein